MLMESVLLKVTNIMRKAKSVIMLALIVLLTANLYAAAEPNDLAGAVVVVNGKIIGKALLDQAVQAQIQRMTSQGNIPPQLLPQLEARMRQDILEQLVNQ